MTRTPSPADSPPPASADGPRPPRASADSTLPGPADGPPPGQPVPQLPPRARQRLVEVAAEVLARMPPEQLPPGLRAIARFTPAKRLRFGARALAGALDAEADFRAAVLEAVDEATPGLAEAVRSAAAACGPLASDPLDVAAVAYLLRPDGWQALVERAGEQWRAEHERVVAGGAAQDLARLRAENGELRARIRTEAAAARAATEAQLADARQELSELRRALRARGAELRAAERARDDALAAAVEATARADAAESGRDAESRRLRARISDLERAAEAARRGARAGRDLDDARLWLLVETMTEAAAGIRRELALTSPALRPADTVPAGTGADSPDHRRRVTDPGTLDRLLALPAVHLVIDGYNVTKTGYAEMSLADQRTRLVNAVAALVGRTGIEVTVAFDGGNRPPAQPPAPRGVRVLFSAVDEIADDLIRRLVAAEPPGRPVVVVSTDQQVATDVRAAGAWSAPSATLLELLG